MAQFEIDGITELAKAMEAMGMDAGKLADAVLLAGADAARDVWREVAEKYDLRDTGEMIASIGFAKKPKNVEGAKSIDIYPQGNATTKNGETGFRNATKAFWIHYGDPDKKGSGWVDEVNIRAKEPVGAAMAGVWEQYLQTGEIPDVYYLAPKKTPTTQREQDYDNRRGRARRG